MPKNNQTSSLFFPAAAPAQSIQVEHDLNAIFEAQSARVMSICSDFTHPSHLSAILVGQVIDAGRANSSLPDFLTHGTAFFHDHYHREMFFNPYYFFTLGEESCIQSTSNKAIKLTPVVSESVSFIYHYLLAKYDGRFIPKIIGFDVPLKYSQRIERMWFVEIPREVDSGFILHDLGLLGALPNRDIQLDYFLLKFNTVSDLQDYYFDIMSSHYDEKFPKNSPNMSLLTTQASFSQQKTALLARLKQLNQSHRPGLDAEQRLFYSQFLTKLIDAIDFDSAACDEQIQRQASLALRRADSMLKNSKSLSYPTFLRTIEACLDEVSILLTLRQNHAPKTALQFANTAKQFIHDTVGFEPQMATFRSSGMQSVWSALIMSLSFLHHQSTNKPIMLFITHAVYFEVANAMKILFNIPTNQLNNDLSIHILGDINSTAFQGQPVDHHAALMYDACILNFESNILVNQTTMEFIDINAFVEHQFHLRQQAQEHNKPLMVIIDNTMSDFDETYLPFLLMQFDKHITAGQLCVFVCHSGNKYLHLGTDKGLAALLYGYYHPQFFARIDHVIHQELLHNKLGDFSNDSPTLLLTDAFITHGKNEILTFGPLIRERTLRVFHIIPHDLIDGLGYFTVGNPISNASYRDLPSSCDALKNSCGFITIHTHRDGYYRDDPIHEDISYYLNQLFLTIGISARSGFGFNQTNQIQIQTLGYSSAIRISIGTESLDEMLAAIKALCAYLTNINSMMEHLHESALASHQLPAINVIYQQAVEQYFRGNEGNMNPTGMSCNQL